MRSIKLMASILAISMIVSGLAIVSGGADTGDSIQTMAIDPPEVKTTVPRTVLLEDFTSWECPPCASFNPVLSSVIASNGYTKVAPAMYHVWWPNYDDDPIYQYDIDEVTDKVAYYGCNYVPWFIVDGTQQTTSTTASVLQGYIDDRAAVPANVSIDTQGWISGGIGEIGVTVEAVENIAATDLYVRVMLWETDITRPLWNYRLSSYDAPPYPNGETILEWGVWDYVPDDKGTPIWPAGASIGDKVEFILPFDISDVDGLIDANVGVTIFVQSESTKYVEQAAVEEFSNVPPMPVSIASPDPVLGEQILSGTIPIQWSAADTEDTDSTLDISIDYSPDGGATWTNIMTGTDNNVAPFTYDWDTVSGAIPDGPGYIIRVKAIDSQGDFGYAYSQEAFTIDNTLDDEWYLQIETSGANMDLDVKPVENTETFVSTADITTGGDYIVGTWETTQTFTDSNINGEWTFNIYGVVPDPGFTPLEGYLYAKIFTSSNTGTPMDTTINDDQDVGTFQTSNLFTWTDTLAGNIGNGDSIIIEIWLNAISGSVPATFESANSDFISGSSSWVYSDVTNDGDGLGVADGTWYSTGGNPDGYIDVSLTPPGTGQPTRAIVCGYWEQQIDPGCIPTDATLDLDWSCFAVGSDQEFTYAYAFIDTWSGAPSGGTPDLIATSVWNTPVTSTSGWSSTGSIDVSGVVNSDTTYYFKLMFRTALDRSTGSYNLGFDNAKISWTQASPVFIAEFDYGTTQSNVEPTIGSGGGPLPTSYDIPILGTAGAGDWVFVSFPYVMSGDIVDMLNDAKNGDGQTTWDIAKWYDPQDAADPWKSYNTGLPAALNDLTTISYAQGVWLRLVTNGGDNVITTGFTGDYSGSDVGVQLYAGWNLVGFPSASSAAADVSLTGTGADMIGVYQASAPYVADTTTLSSVTMSEGNAYWVHVDADTTWNVGA